MPSTIYKRSNNRMDFTCSVECSSPLATSDLWKKSKEKPASLPIPISRNSCVCLRLFDIYHVHLTYSKRDEACFARFHLNGEEKTEIFSFPFLDAIALSVNGRSCCIMSTCPPESLFSVQAETNTLPESCRGYTARSLGKRAEQVHDQGYMPWRRK